jgi:predicted nuclease with TOPRIM domain
MGSCAHALFNFLISEGTIEEKTPEDKSEIARIENEITRLQAEYDNDEEVRGDLLDEISELEDELTELDAKMDVYNMLPIGDYVLKEFTTTEFQGRWKVGDSDDTEREAVRYVKDLIDDTGYDGFNQSFVMEHFDEDSFIMYLREFFEEDVYNNPEIYLDDSDKELSRSQEARIFELKETITNLESEKESLDDEDEDYESEYERLNDEITILQEEIQEIEDDPDGEYDSDKLVSVVSERISEYGYDAKDFYENYLGGGDFTQWCVDNGFINDDEFAQAVVDTDGYGTTLNAYDGSEESIRFDGETYYIFYDGDFH